MSDYEFAILKEQDENGDWIIAETEHYITVKSDSDILIDDTVANINQAVEDTISTVRGMVEGDVDFNLFQIDLFSVQLMNAKNLLDYALEKLDDLITDSQPEQASSDDPFRNKPWPPFQVTYTDSQGTKCDC